MPRFLETDPKGLRALHYLSKLGAHFQPEREGLLKELELLSFHVGHINQLVAKQQSYAKVSGLVEDVSLSELVNPPARQDRGWPVFRREQWSAGDLLVATARRLLWITDRYKGQHERYGSTSFSAPLESISDFGSGVTDQGTELKISFRSGHSWRIPCHETEEREARKFEIEIGKVVNEITRNKS